VFPPAGRIGKLAEQVSATDAEVCLARAEWQRVLFAPAPRRHEILKLRPTWPLRNVRLRVHRNHGFEPVASVLEKYLAYTGLAVEVAYSAYDDSLSLSTPGPADVELIWLDFSRLVAIGGAEELAAWALERIEALRGKSPAPILFTDAAGDLDRAAEFNAQLRELTGNLPGVHICDLGQLHAQLGPAFFDERTLATSGTRMSNAACVQAARWLGSRWLPAAVAPRIKALALDLDNTLYEGVLGEDGPEGVRLTDAHAALQRRVVELGAEGIFLALCSRNEPADVERLLAVRTDFPLRPEHLAATEVSWGPKADAVRRIADKLRIGTDAILFVDDNPGELAAVASAIPVSTLYAGPTGADSVAALNWYPRLFRWRADETDALRTGDLTASRVREDLAAKAPDKAAYMRSLGVRLQFSRNVQGELERLSALSNKTNQFNLSLSRCSPVDLAQLLAEPGNSAIAIRLSDRLSDSGIIGTMLTRRDGAALIVEDFCISCRALGRDLEDVMALEAIRAATDGLDGIRHVRFHPAVGPRNQPARDWLDGFAGETGRSDPQGWVTVNWDRSAADDLVERMPVIVEHRDPGKQEQSA